MSFTPKHRDDISANVSREIAILRRVLKETYKGEMNEQFNSIVLETRGLCKLYACDMYHTQKTGILVPLSPKERYINPDKELIEGIYKLVDELFTPLLKEINDRKKEQLKEQLKKETDNVLSQFFNEQS